MADTVMGMALNAAEYLAGPVSQGARYLFCYDQFIGVAMDARNELEVRLADMRKDKEEAESKCEEIKPSVQNWLHEVEDILKEVQQLQQKFERGGKNCYNMSLRYSLARQMEKKAKKMKELKDKSHFVPFSSPTELSVSFDTSKDFVLFSSRKSTLESLLKVIKDERNQMMGLYGMGGSGKSVLAKEVYTQVSKWELFEKVVFVTVSRDINSDKLQDDIAVQIGLKFPEESKSNRSQRLRTRLQNLRRTLIILDDVWRTFDLQDIGIPLNKGCRVLLVTRLRRVCVLMNCSSSIELPLLTEDEALALFKIRAKASDLPKEFEVVGRQIVDECKGLPIAIEVVGAILKERSIEAWETALFKLQHSQPLDIEPGLRNPYKCLELSYENLQGPIPKSLFLLCSMFPEDHEIHKEDLVRFSKGAIVPLTKLTMNNARRDILEAIDTLVDSYLLMPTNNRACVKMHDLVRDVSLLIAQKQNQEVLVASHEVPKMLAESERVKDTKVISLWNLEKDFKASYQLHCPALEILLLHSEECIDNFGGIEALKVLAFVRFSFDWILPWGRTKWSMPQSILLLKSLHTICLRGIALGDISFLGEFKGLEILDLRGSSFDELPSRSGDMKKLKLLELFGCSIEKSPYQAIENCEQVEELHLWNKKHVIPKTFPVSGLQRYVICDPTWDFGRPSVPFISVDISWRYSFLQYFVGIVGELRALCIQGCNVTDLSSSMRHLIHRAEILYLENCGWDNKEERNSEIKCLVLVRCQGKRLIFDNPQGQVFHLLTTLRLADMDNLEQVFQDSSINCSLETLRELNVHKCRILHDICFPKSSNLRCLRELQLVSCPMLKLPIFTTSMAQSLVVLEKLHLMNCNNLKHIIAEDEEEWKAYGNSNPCTFQNLRTLEVDSCENLESILPLYFARNLVKLESLSVQTTPKLNYVVGRRKDDRSSLLQKIKYKNPMDIEINMPSLTDVSFAELPGLTCLFPQHYGPSKMGTQNDKVWMVISATFNQRRDAVLPQSLQVFLNLKTLFVKSCMRNEGIFEFRVERVADGEEQEPFRLDSALSSIEMINLPELEFIWKGPAQILSLHRLERVRLWNCPRLRTIFTLVTIANLPELRELYVMNCEEWEGIFSKDSLKTLPASSYNICFPKLSEITIQNCNKVKWVFSYSLACHCPSLETLQIWDCSKLECVVYGFKVEASMNQPLFPKLKSKSSLLNLLKLPKLREVFPGYVHQSNHVIQDCPNLSDLFTWYHE